jgi:hypothetical protein
MAAAAIKIVRKSGDKALLLKALWCSKKPEFMGEIFEILEEAERPLFENFVCFLLQSDASADFLEFIYIARSRENSAVLARFLWCSKKSEFNAEIWDILLQASMLFVSNFIEFCVDTPREYIQFVDYVRASGSQELLLKFLSLLAYIPQFRAELLNILRASTQFKHTKMLLKLLAESEDAEEFREFMAIRKKTEDPLVHAEVLHILHKSDKSDKPDYKKLFATLLSSLKRCWKILPTETMAGLLLFYQKSCSPKHQREFERMLVALWDSRSKPKCGALLELVLRNAAPDSLVQQKNDLLERDEARKFRETYFGHEQRVRELLLIVNLPTTLDGISEANASSAFLEYSALLLPFGQNAQICRLEALVGSQRFAHESVALRSIIAGTFLSRNTENNCHLLMSNVTQQLGSAYLYSLFHGQ